MNIIETHTHLLRFKIDYNVSNKYINKWKKLKKDCENTNNMLIVEEIKNNCKLETNKNLPYLERCEGGLGGNDNGINKQIRFVFNWCSPKYDNSILLDVKNTEIEKWTYEELDDMVRSFIIVLNKKIGCECVSGCIELNNKMMYDDNYFDSD